MGSVKRSQVDSEICYTFTNFHAVWILNSGYKRWR